MKTLLIDCKAEKRSALASALSQAGHEVEYPESLGDDGIDNRFIVHELIFLDTDTSTNNWRETLARLCHADGRRCGFIVAVTERREQAHLLDLLGDPAGNGSSGEHVDDVLFWPIEQRQLDGHLAAAQSRAFSRDRDLDEIVLSGSSASVETIADSALFDGQLDGFLIADASSQRFLAANPPICRMLGYTKKELLRMSVPDIHPVEDLKVIQDHFASNLHLRTPATDTLQFLRKDGSVCPGRISTYAIQYRGRLCLIGFIRERSQRNDKWATSEETFKTFISKSAYGFVDFDAKGFVRSTNDRLAAFLGYDDGELRGMHFLQLLDKSVRKRAVGDFKNSAETVLKPPRNYLAMKKNGETCSVETSSIPLFKSGKLVGFQSAVLDVSERIKTETALIKSEGMLRSLIENMPGLVLVVDREARIKYTNRGDENHTPEELVGQTDFDMVHPDYFQACRESLQKAFSTQSVQHLEALGKSGIWWSCQQVPMIENGRAETVMIICNDVTRQKKSDEKIRQEQELLRKMLEMHERDRELIAFEIHDGFSQQLTGALMNLDASVQLSADDPRRSKESFERGVRLLRESIVESRRLVAGLRPPVLEEFGIIPAIEQLVDENEKNGAPQTEFSSNIIDQRLPPSLESAIFRIVQETLNNARRHSQADKIRLDIFQDGEHVRLVIQDWGVGFELEEVADDRFGLKGICERARLLGGRSEIETKPGKGTRITIKLPVLLESRPENEIS